MPKIEYNAELLADGHLSCPSKVIERLKLKVGSQIKVLLINKESHVSKDSSKNFISLRNSLPELKAITKTELEETKSMWDQKIDKIANEL